MKESRKVIQPLDIYSSYALKGFTPDPAETKEKDLTIIEIPVISKEDRVKNRKLKNKGKEPIKVISTLSLQLNDNGVLCDYLNIGAYDRRVHVALCSLYEEGRRDITINQIAKRMGYLTNANKRVLENISNSLLRLMSTILRIENTAEAERYKGYPKIKITEVFAPVKIIDMEQEILLDGRKYSKDYYRTGSYVEQYGGEENFHFPAKAIIRFLDIPPLLFVAKGRKQITTHDLLVYQSTIPKTDYNLQVEEKLLYRIARGYRKVQINLQNLLEEMVWIDESYKGKYPIFETVNKYLTYYQKIGHIKGFDFYDDRKTGELAGVNIYKLKLPTSKIRQKPNIQQKSADKKGAKPQTLVQ